MEVLLRTLAPALLDGLNSGLKCMQLRFVSEGSSLTMMGCFWVSLQAARKKSEVDVKACRLKCRRVVVWLGLFIAYRAVRDATEPSNYIRKTYKDISFPFSPEEPL